MRCPQLCGFIFKSKLKINVKKKLNKYRPQKVIKTKHQTKKSLKKTKNTKSTKSLYHENIISFNKLYTNLDAKVKL